jgi:multiple sugar transport system ATP-binding protein
MVAGLEPITGGDLLIDGQRMNEVPAAKRGIAMVFQSYALYPHMSVYKNLAFGLETARFPRAEIEQRVRRAAEILRIENLLQRRPKQLSGGQRQRVAIGRAIVRDPRIFLFDEPLSNLDAELRVQMRVEIAKLHNDLGTTMVYVTHDQVEAMTMADKIVVLNAGVIEQVGTPLELYNNPVNRFVAGFLGSPKMNFLESTVAKVDGSAATVNVGGTMFTLRQQVTSRSASDKIVFGIRPEHMGITEAAGTKLADVRVDLVEQLGDQTMLYASTQGGQPLTIALNGQQSIAAGTTVTAYVDPTKYHAFSEDGRAL